jgi:hypothetical protein
LRFLRRFLPPRFEYTQPDPSLATSLEAAAATFMMIRREAYSAVGGMDESYFLYVEDTDLCQRWHDAGWEVWIEPKVEVVHDWQGGSGSDPILRQYHRAGLLRYFRTHHSDKPVRNSTLAMLFSLMGAWDRLRYGQTGVPQS